MARLVEHLAINEVIISDFFLLNKIISSDLTFKSNASSSMYFSQCMCYVLTGLFLGKIASSCCFWCLVGFVCDFVGGREVASGIFGGWVFGLVLLFSYDVVKIPTSHPPPLNLQ